MYSVYAEELERKRIARSLERHALTAIVGVFLFVMLVIAGSVVAGGLMDHPLSLTLSLTAPGR